jgi:hypothetical protein
MVDSPDYSGPERRQNASLRELFDAAYLMIEPFFDASSGWAGHSLEHLAFRVLRENFPSLSSGEVHAIIVAAHRLYIDRNPSASSHLKRPDQFTPR